jgi:hypothetical protein
MRIDIMNKLNLLSSSFIMALTLAAPFATSAMEPGEDHQAVAKKAAPASIRFLFTYLGAGLGSDMPILEAIYHSAPLRQVEQFERFLNGKLIYKPDPNSDEGMVVMPIADLPNPLEGEFDLSKCGDAGQYLSINTGYRKGLRPENKDKVEIWFAAKFVIEENRQGSASHFKDLPAAWGPVSLKGSPHRTAPVVTFFTWGNWDNLRWYEYITNLAWESYSDPEYNLRKLHLRSRVSQAHAPHAGERHSNFHVIFN